MYLNRIRLSIALLVACGCAIKQVIPEVKAEGVFFTNKQKLRYQKNDLCSVCINILENDVHRTSDDCQVTPVIHVLQYPGCVPKPIPSFACIGRCESYIQVSGSKIWQLERSCMCCQESGEREASVALFCPRAKQGERKFRKVGFSIDNC